MRSDYIENGALCLVWRCGSVQSVWIIYSFKSVMTALLSSKYGTTMSINRDVFLRRVYYGTTFTLPLLRCGYLSPRSIVFSLRRESIASALMCPVPLVSCVIRSCPDQIIIEEHSVQQ